METVFLREIDFFRWYNGYSLLFRSNFEKNSTGLACFEGKAFITILVEFMDFIYLGLNIFVNFNTYNLLYIFTTFH